MKTQLQINKDSFMLKHFFTIAVLIAGFNANAQVHNSQVDPVSKALAQAQFKDLYNQGSYLKEYNPAYKSGILVNIWATWCAPCVKELPSLFRLQSAYPDLTVITLSIDRHEKIVKNFFKRQRIPNSYVHLIDKNGSVVKQLGYTKVPTTLLIDNKGKIVETYIGERKWDSPHMIAKIKASLEQAAKDRTYYY
jgi:thiol-disulfide isomerase/thioredoxin